MLKIVSIISSDIANAALVAAFVMGFFNEHF
jgi:hypothetical protein